MIRLGLIGSLIIPFGYFFTDHTIDDFILFKYFFLLIAFLGVVIKGTRKSSMFALYIITYSVLKLSLSLIVGVNINNAVIATHVVYTPFIYWFIFDHVKVKHIKSTYSVLAIMEICAGLYFYGIGQSWQNAATTIGGHFTSWMVWLSPVGFLFAPFAFLGSSSRFASVAFGGILNRLNWRFLGYLFVIFLIIVPNILTVLGTTSQFYKYSAGYRVFEYLVFYDYLGIANILFGKLPGTSMGLFSLGSKGIIENAGLFHNYLLNVVLNIGLPLVVLMFFRLKKFLDTKDKKLLFLILIAVVIYDGPRDGHWEIGLVLSLVSRNKDVLLSKNRKNEKIFV